MGAITICSDFGAPQNKVWHCFHCFPIYFPWSDGIGCHDLRFLNVELFHPAYLTFMPSTSWETLDWKKHKLESRLPGEISITSICRLHHPYGRKWRGTKKPLDESERGAWKSWFKAQHSEVTAPKLFFWIKPQRFSVTNWERNENKLNMGTLS